MLKVQFVVGKKQYELVRESNIFFRHKYMQNVCSTLGEGQHFKFSYYKVIMNY